ncbi:MAG: hypothetical protein DRR19_27345 [Candidatus Parabeggiatoa sp. nov. 1]|nr:MAG: hypothetical protein DRR19_27345 [Gammaproteobacteria bacterium]
MQALRKVYQKTPKTVTINIPTAFQNMPVEIIILPLDEAVSPGIASQQMTVDNMARSLTIVEFIKATESLRRQLAGRTHTDSVELLREDRNR